MPTIYDAVVLASVVVGLVTVPAASQTIDGSASATGDFVSKSLDSSPRNTETTVGPEGFHHRLKTAFSSFREDISPGNTEVKLETPSTTFTIDSEPGMKETELVSDSGKLTVRRTDSKIVEKTETPEGVLRRVKKHGKVTESFSGSSRDSVEETRRELKALMEEHRKKAMNRSEKLEQSKLPDIGLSVSPEDGEHVTITNEEGRKLSLEGWKLEDASGTTFTFPDVDLPPGESLKVYTSEGKNSGNELHWGTSNVWNNGGDTATLFNSKGEKLAEKSY